MRKQFAGGAVSTTLAAAASSSASTIQLADASTFPSGSSPFVVAINRGSAAEEKLLIGSRTGNALTVTTRGYDGTSAVAHIVNEVVEHVLDAETIDEANEFANLMTTRGDLMVYGASGPTRLAKGTIGQVLQMEDSNDPAWVDAAETQSESSWTPTLTGAGLVLGTGTGLSVQGGYSEQNGMCHAWFSIISGTTSFAHGTIGTIELPVPLRSGLSRSALSNKLGVGLALFGSTGAVPAILTFYDTGTNGSFFPMRSTDGATSPVSNFTAASNILSGTLQYPV